MTKSKKTSKTRQKFDFGMEPKITTLLPTCFKIIAIHLVCRCSLPVWRRSFLKKGTPPLTYFCPALDPTLGGSGRKTTTLVRDHEYFIPTKFHQNPSSGFGEEVENVKSLRTDDDDGRTDDGRCAMTIAHSSLQLRWAKKKTVLNFYYMIEFNLFFVFQFNLAKSIKFAEKNKNNWTWEYIWYVSVIS